MSIMLTPPTKAVEELNNQILEFHPKKEHIKTIVLVALCCIAGVGMAFTSPLLGVLGFFFIGTAITIDRFQTYSKLRKTYSEIEHEIKELPKGQFYYFEHSVSDGNLSLQQFDQIKKYLPQDNITEESIHLLVRHRMLYEITGGEIEPYSVQPLQITLIEQVDNEQKVLQIYRPWIDLLLAIEESDNVPQKQKIQMCKAIGRMIHKPKGWEINIIKAQVNTTPSMEEPYFTINVDNENQPYIIRYHQQAVNSYFNAKQFADFLEQEYQLNVTA